jgi:hypothetical protein
MVWSRVLVLSALNSCPQPKRALPRGRVQYSRGAFCYRSCSCFVLAPPLSRSRNRALAWPYERPAAGKVSGRRDHGEDHRRAPCRASQRFGLRGDEEAACHRNVARDSTRRLRIRPKQLFSAAGKTWPKTRVKARLRVPPIGRVSYLSAHVDPAKARWRCEPST